MFCISYFIVNVSAPIELEVTQFADQVRMRLISQVIKGISRVPQNYLSILILLLFQHLLYAAGFFPVILTLGMNDLEVTIAVSCGSSW